MANQNLDSAISLGKMILQDAVKANYKLGEGITRIRLANNYCFKGDYAAAATDLAAASAIFNTLNDSANISRVFAAYGMMNGMQTRYDSAIYFYQKSIAIDERNNFKEELSRSYSNIAISFQMQSNFTRALQYQQKSLQLAEERKDESTQARTLVNIGITYKTIGDLTRAEQSLLKAEQLAKKNNIKVVELYAYSNLSTVYQTRRQHEKAYAYAMKSAELGLEMGDQGIRSTGLSKAAAALAEQHRYAEAEKLIEQAVAVADSSRQPLNIYQTNNTFGSINKAQGRYKEAIRYYEKGFAVMSSTDIYDEQIGESYKELSQCYENTGEYKKSLEAFKLYSLIKDSVISKENVRKATETSMNFEFEKKQQAAAAAQEQKDAVASARQLALMIGLGCALLLIIGIFVGYRNKLKAYAMLRRQKEELNIAFTKLRQTQAQLVHAEKMASLGELTAGIAHEIQNPLNFVNNFSEVSAEMADEIQEAITRNDYEEVQLLAKDIRENLDKIAHHGKRADAIVKNMLQHSRTSTGTKEATDINTLVEEYMRLSYHGVRAKEKSFNATLNTNFDAGVGKVDIIPQDVGRVILNLVTNALHATGEKKKNAGDTYEPVVTVGTQRLKDKILVTVQDNGSGIADAIKEKIFQPFFTTKPTGQGTGLGLSLSYDIIKAHNGDITVASAVNEGTTFTIELPV
ncbi:tetratricopeptide repeat protein [Panacibacter sp. DH6]|uniref:histidine kinase n=1 Tax=Panacibacter microcysteis TaxID=2793269 RepID=A0A931E294_9BACT|nr:tetratricopeptide repeat protein [Panacibacter microcysteis]MBG9377242.1 tetratricopeptide repeat protein [Panacibacter microcysteis]